MLHQEPRTTAAAESQITELFKQPRRQEIRSSVSAEERGFGGMSLITNGHHLKLQVVYSASLQ